MTHIPQQDWLLKSDMAGAYESYTYWATEAAYEYRLIEAGRQARWPIGTGTIHFAMELQRAATKRRDLARDAYFELKAALYARTGEVYDTPHAPYVYTEAGED